MSIFHTVGFWIKPASGVVYEPDFQTYLDSLVTPLSDLQKQYMNEYYVGIKTDFNINLLSEIADQILFLAGETAGSSLKNIVKRAHDATAVKSPTYTQYEGVAGDGISAYIDTNFNGFQDGSTYALNNASIGVYSRTNVDVLDAAVGCHTNSTNFAHIVMKNSGFASMRVHNGVYPFINESVADSLGMYFATRNAANQAGLTGWKNKVNLPFYSGTGNTTSIPDLNFYLLARNNAGTAERFAPRQLAFSIMGRYYNKTEVGYLTDRFETYMDKRGKGVIS